jgi:hypothetical protein
VAGMKPKISWQVNMDFQISAVYKITNKVNDE